MVTLDVAARQPGEGFLERLDRSRRAAQERLAARNAELRAAGIRCVACEDTGLIGGERFCLCSVGRDLARAENRHRVRVLITMIPESIGIPQRYRDVNLDTFPDQDSPTLAQVRAWLDDAQDPRKPGLLLYGGFGRGKTGLLASIIRTLTLRHFVYYDEAGEPQVADSHQAFTNRLRFADFAQFTTATGLLESLRPRPGRDDDATFSRYLECQYLAIDDLGAERLTPWGADRLYEIVNERYNRLLPLIVSSNLSPDQLADRINSQLGDRSGDRILERLADSCTFIAISDSEPNWRVTPIAS